ncbi:MAG: twin-arginine translocase TatA/TatE family subunit [Cellvibrionaceae bacterium]|nr:twin-arginine translocase TatA/TatE family subunit [Cellvibrionaceae bacterium]
MGIGGISIWQLLIILAIVLVLFGTKRLRGLGGDLGSAIKSFKKAVSEEEDKEPQKKVADDATMDNTAEVKQSAEKQKQS